MKVTDNSKRVTIFAGHYGSGKTNIAINYAKELKKSGRNVFLADLDIVNPYFRSKDSEDELKAAGIELICSDFASTNVDIPALPQNLYRTVQDKNSCAVLDIGGDDAGSIVLGRLSDKLKEENGDYVPSIVFQHIPVEEIYELLIEVPEGTPNSARGFRQWEGKFFAVNPERVTVDNRTFIGETPSVPEENGGQFEVMNEKGDVMAMFFGHDHNNSFVGEYKGMRMGYTQGCGFNVYGPGRKRGVRIFDFDESNPRDFTTTTLTVEDLDEFKITKKLKHGFYTYAPTSVDAVKLIAKKYVLPIAGAVATVATIGSVIKKKK